MLRPLFYRALNSLPLAGFRRAAGQFGSALANPEEVQRRLLLHLLRQNRGAYSESSTDSNRSAMLANIKTACRS